MTKILRAVGATFVYKMWGTSRHHAKFTGDHGSAIEVIRISDRSLRSVFAKNFEPCNFRLLQQYRHKADISPAFVWSPTLARQHKMPADKTRRTTTSRDAAEAAFKAATTKPAELPPKRPTIPNAKELVSLRLDRDVLDYFQDAGPGWQDRINEALRKIIGK